MAKVKTNFASLTDAQNAAPAATESANTKSTGFNFSSLADSEVSAPEVQPSKKKVDTGLSGTTSFLDSSFKAKGPLFDSKEELTRLGKIEGALTPEERAQRAEDARQQKIAEDKLANYKRSVIYDAVSNAAGVAGVSKPFLAGIADVGAAATGLVGIVNNFTDKEISAADYVIEALSGKKDVISGLAKEATGGKSFSELAYEASNELSGLSGALTEKTKKEVGISNEDLAKGPIDLMLEGKLADGLKVTAVEVVKAIPQVIVQSALAPEAAAGFLTQKAATFATTSAMALGQNIAQDYAQDKDISAEDALKSMAKSAIEGLTETIFRTDINAVKGIGASLVKGETSVAKELIKGVIEKEGKEAAKQEIARGFSKPLAKMLSKGFEGASVVGKFNKGGIEEGIEEVMSTVGSFIVDRVADGKWSEADYNQLLKDSGNAFALGYSSGGFINGVTAQLSMKKLTDEQKAKVEKFNEVANNEELSAEVRKIARDKANDIIRESADQSYAGYDELTRLPVEKRVQAFSLLSDINAQEESKKNIKDVDMIAAIDKSIEAKKADYDYLLTGIKPSTQPVVEKAPATEEEKQTTAKIQTEEQAYQEELAKADKSWKETIGMPSEPMKVSSQFSIRANPEELGVNNAHEPSPNMPIEVDKKTDGKKVQFTTKENPDALLEGDVYTINQGNNKFATILSANRNGVQEYYVPELPDAKPFANLDDAKFAVQEKLTGVRVKEIERSGIDRLRADKFIPKADIVVRTDNGQEVLLDPVAKKSIQNAVKAFKSVSNAPVYLYRNTEDFKKGVAKELGSESKALESAGQVGGGFFTNARNEDSIHINLANISATTVAHELFHGTVVNVARQNPSAFAEMRDAIINKLGDNDLINVSDEKGKLVKLSAKEYLDRYSKQYSPEQQAEEFLSELTGLLATDMAKLKDPTIWETIKLAIRNLVKTANIDIPIFEKTANINDTVKFFTDLSKSLKTGQEIKLEKLKIQNDKEAVKQGTAVQATNGESQIAEEDESLRDSVSKTVTQRRKGNELGKKKRKLSAVAAKAMAIEPTTPDDYALQYFINGGQVIRGSKDDTTEKDTVFSLFSKSRMGGAKESVSEMRARVRIMAGRDAGGLSISEIAEKIFAEYQQATKGDVGIDVNTQYDFMDFKNAVESAILGHKSDTAMANTLLESKNKPAEEGAIALTEEQELEALRIKAEAQALGLTEEEFMAKLAELQDTPEMQAAEEAYAQALDMIDDEDFAKLYELNDDDIAKIDELMAGVESTEGALDDKLAEQKKIVRDLEAERKKVLAAIEKAGKEKQLDIEGKAPIQEQLFATDTKSLTDKLQSIETQLTAAKADVAATQSAIDFQERGTVDMFEQETKPEPQKPYGRPLSEETTEILKISRFGGNEQLEAWTEELELLDEKISKLEKAGKGRGFQSLDWFKEQAEKYRRLVKNKKIELAEIEAELASREAKSEETNPAQPETGEFKLISNPGETIFDTISRVIEPDIIKSIEASRKEAEKTNSTFDKRDEDYIRLALQYDLLNAVGAYLQKGDKLVDAKVRRSVKGFDLTATVSRDGKEYNFRTTSTPAGGYNIQRFHYRYLVNTNVPASKASNFDSIKNRMKAITASKKIEKEISYLKGRIELEKQKIESNKNMSDKEALKDWYYKDITWETIVKRGADVNYNYDKNAFEKAKEEDRQIELGKRDRNIKSANLSIKSLEASLKREQTKLDKVLSDFPQLAQAPATEEQSTPASETTKPVVDEAVPESNTEKIEDFGEKIGGAKKDLVKKALDSYNMDLEVDSNVKYSQLLPLLNYNALIKEGALTQDGAILIDYIKGRIPTKPKNYNKSRWISQMIDARQTIYQILNDDMLDVQNLIDNLSEEDLVFKNTFRAMKGIGFPQSGLSLGNYFIREFGANNFAVVNGFRVVGDRHQTFDEAAEALRELLSANKSKTKETKFAVWERRSTKENFIGKKVGSNVITVMGGFKTSAEAYAYIAENRPALEEIWKEMRQNPDERRGENKVRVGEDYRKGRNISGEEFGKTFGFRGVEFGNWVNNKERQQSVNEAYDALMDLSTALGISPNAISLGGKLGLAFGARGSGKAMAHYESTRTVINLTKTKGAGSLAHEWWHALDNYFASPKSDSFITERTKDSSIQARQEVKDAFANVVRVINKETGIKSRSSKLDKARTSEYWSTDVEMTARSFESFVVSKLAETGNSNDYLANFKELTDWSNGGSVSAESYPYPSPEEKDVISKAYQELFNTIQERQEGAKTILFQKQGISVAPAYKYQMNEMFKDPERLITDIKNKYDLRTTLRERGKVEGSLIEVERKLADNMVVNALSRMAKPVFKGIGAVENAALYKSGKGEDVRTKDFLMYAPKWVGDKLKKATLEAIQGTNKYSAQAGRVASSLIGNLAKTESLQEARKKKEGLVKDQNNEIAMLSKSLNGMIGFSKQSLMRVHSLLDPEAFLEEEEAVQAPKDLDLQELRLYNVLRDMNDFIHEWHFQNEFIDAPTYEKHKGKYFARMYEEIERKEFADLHDAIDKMPSGADFRMFKERKDFSEIELTLMNDPIYITSRRFATMIHNKAIIEFSNAMANDPAYKFYSKLEDVPEENRSGFKQLGTTGGGKRYGELTGKYVPITIYEELRGTTFANKYIAGLYDVLRGYDGMPTRQYLKKSLTVYQPVTRSGNITSNFAFAWLAGVDPFTMMKNRVRAKDSLDNYDEWAKDLAAAGVLGTDIISIDLAQRKKQAEKGKPNWVDKIFLDKYAKGEQALVDKLVKLGASADKIEKAKQARDKVVAKAIEGDKYLVESYGRTDDISKIALYRSLVDDYGKDRDEAAKIVAESMQNYTTVGKAYQFFSKMPLIGNPFVKFSSDLARIISNGLVNRPLYTASFLGMLYGMHRLLSGLSGEPEEEREARVSRPFIPKIPLGFTDIPLVWKIGKYEFNVAKFISPYYVYDAGYRSNTIAELSKFAPLQVSYEDKVGIISDYLPVFSDILTAPLAQLILDKDFKSLPIADTFDSIFTRQTVTEDEAALNRLNYFGKSYFSPVWGMVSNLISAAKGEPDMYGRRRDIGSSVLNNFIKVQEFESKDVQRSIINQIKYIDSEYKQIKTDITSRRNNDSDRVLEIMQSDMSDERKKEKIDKIDEDFRTYVGEMTEKMQILTEKRAEPWNRLYNMQNPKKND